MELISKVEFARRAGITPSAVTQLTKEGKKLNGALVGPRLDIDSEAARRYAHENELDLTAPHKKETVPAPNSKGKKAKAAVEEGPDMPGSDTPILPLFDMTLRELTVLFGTDLRFKEWTLGRKNLAEIRKKDLEYEEAIGKVVSRQVIKAGVFEPIDQAFRRMLTDAARTIASQVSAHAKAGGDPVEAEKLVREVLASHIRPSKAKAVRTLKSIEEKGEDI